MTTTVIPATCVCGSIGRTDLRQCPDHFHIWNGDARLVSVGRVIRAIWPEPTIPADVIENARDRGEQVDRLFASYVRGELKRIPAGTRKDAVDLFFKLQKWYDKQNFKDVETQVIVGSAKYGGVCDFIFDGVLTDLKATYDPLPTHFIQVGGYLAIAGTYPDEDGAVLHVTERNAEPRVLPVHAGHVEEWLTLVDAYELLERHGALKGKTA